MTAFIPNFFVAGAPKAGTSSVHQWIADHPDALGSREKETYFFVDPDTHMYNAQAHVSKGYDTWADQFDLPDGKRPKIIVESTPSYIYFDTALDHIPDLPTQPKCLFILREPAAQIRSLHSYFQNNWNWIPADMSFEDFVAVAHTETGDFKGNELARHAIRYGKYVDYLRKWRERLGDERMMVIGFDDLKRDGAGTAKRVAEWLGLDPSFYDTYSFPRENETYVPRNRALQNLNVALRSKLPKGAVYQATRSLYRKVATRRGKVELKNEDRAVLDQLRVEFAQANQELFEEFGVDLRQKPAEGVEG